MAKDPAFLMYSKDWIEGTAELSVSAKGVYIDLLCYQHQKGNLPTDSIKLARLVRLSVTEFNPIWDEINDKFEIYNDRMVNPKLEHVMSERSSKGRTNKLIGTFGHVLKKLNLNKKDTKLLKSKFNVTEMLNDGSEWNSERLTEWCKNTIVLIEDVNEDVIINDKEFIDFFNLHSNKKFRVLDDKTEKQLNARFKEGFTYDDFKTAIVNCKKDEYHMQNPQYLTPEFITRSDKLQKYLMATKPKIVIGL